MAREQNPQLDSEALRAIKKIKKQDVLLYFISVCAHNSSGITEVHQLLIKALASRATFEERQFVISQNFANVHSIEGVAELTITDKLLIKQYSRVIIDALAQAARENVAALGLRPTVQRNCKPSGRARFARPADWDFVWIKQWLERVGLS